MFIIWSIVLLYKQDNGHKCLYWKIHLDLFTTEMEAKKIPENTVSGRIYVVEVTFKQNFNEERSFYASKFSTFLSKVA